MFESLKFNCTYFNAFTDCYDRHVASISPVTNATSSGITGVVIVTYMRSGSSLTGDILQQSPDVFYVYEPLQAFNIFNTRSADATNLTFVNGTIRYYNVALLLLKTRIVRDL